MNIIQAWLFMIGTPANASKLQLRLDSLKPPELDPSFGPEPRQCPLTVLYGAEVSRLAYADPELRPALDAWDTGYLTTGDLRRYCLEIERGKYEGAVLNPVALTYATKLRVEEHTRRINASERSKVLQNQRPRVSSRRG